MYIIDNQRLKVIEFLSFNPKFLTNFVLQIPLSMDKALKVISWSVVIWLQISLVSSSALVRSSLIEIMTLLKTLVLVSTNRWTIICCSSGCFFHWTNSISAIFTWSFSWAQRRYSLFKSRLGKSSQFWLKFESTLNWNLFRLYLSFDLVNLGKSSKCLVHLIWIC